MNNLILSIKKAAEKEKKEQLKVYFKQNFKRDKLPGEVSLPVNMFSSELHRENIQRKNKTLNPSESFKDKISTS